MTLKRIASWGLKLLPVVIVVLLWFGYWQLQAIQTDIQKARAAIVDAQRTVESVTGELRSVRDSLSTARHRVDSIYGRIQSLDRTVTNRVGRIDRRIGDLRTRMQRVDARLSRQLDALRADSIDAPIYVESDS